MAQQQHRGGGATGAFRGRTWRMVAGRAGRCRGGSLVGLGLVGAVLAADRCLAQTQTRYQVRLTVRPHEMATGTRTTRGGMFRLDLPSRNLMYVPQQCVGTRRCPLLVNSNSPWQYPTLVADKYGMIVLEIDGSGSAAEVAELDRAMKEILRTFAIDPNKIAILGRCGSGTQTVAYGAQNPNVFSRIATFTQNTPDTIDLPVKASNPTAEYYASSGLVEAGANFRGVRELRDRGYAVKHSMQFRGHMWAHEDYELMGRWLQESWAIPDPAARPAPFAFGDPPLLTSEVIAKMNAFWTRFLEEPDSIRTTARRAWVREVVVPVGPERISTLMVDMVALAAKYPSVAAALKAAGLIAQQHDAYRAALVSARIIKDNDEGNAAYYQKVPVEPSSALARNVEFMKTHPDDFPIRNSGVAGRTPGITAMWSVP